MNSAKLLFTHGDPKGTARKFLGSIWSAFNLDKMLVSLNASLTQSQLVQILYNPQQLTDINPFNPLMVINSAKYIPAFLNENPNQNLGVVLRPCEIRALDELKKFQSFQIDNLITISFDCLGTYPREDYQWRARRRGINDNLNEDSIQFARQGGIATYRYRSACQMCIAPGAMDADINIQVIGLPARQYLVVTLKNNLAFDRLQVDDFSDIRMKSESTRQREWMLAKIVDRNGGVRDRVKNALTDLLPTDIEGMLSYFNTCGECNNCLNACPLIQSIVPKIEKTGNVSKEELIQWIISCSGCGMCEQSCPNHYPLNAIFYYLKELLNEPIFFSNSSRGK
jgi:formate dehydrogenase subunit beta